MHTRPGAPCHTTHNGRFLQRQAYRSQPTTIQRCQGQSEKFVSISDALKEVSNPVSHHEDSVSTSVLVFPALLCCQARQQDSNFVFEDNEDGKVWMHEERLAKDPIDFESEHTR